MKDLLFKRCIKRSTALLIAAVLAFLSAGCTSFSLIRHDDADNSLGQQQPASDENVQFTEYANELFRDSICSDALSLHAYLEHPENYGISDYDVTLGGYDLDALDSTADITECLNELKAFDRSTLSASQQITYDQLLQFFETELEYSDLYLFDTSLSTTIGLQVQLPIIFAEYAFLEEKDVKEYLTLLADTDRFMQNLVDPKPKRLFYGRQPGK